MVSECSSQIYKSIKSYKSIEELLRLELTFISVLRLNELTT